MTPGNDTFNLFARIGAGLASLLLLCMLGMQLIPIPETNPPVVAEPKWASVQTRQIAQRACFDCHSNETVWPWYAKIAPVSWMVARDVLEGREHLNFSEWGVSQDGEEGEEGEEGDEIGEVILNGEMPPANYILVHLGAALTDAEKRQLIDGFANTLTASR